MSALTSASNIVNEKPIETDKERSISVYRSLDLSLYQSSVFQNCPTAAEEWTRISVSMQAEFPSEPALKDMWQELSKTLFLLRTVIFKQLSGTMVQISYNSPYPLQFLEAEDTSRFIERTKKSNIFDKLPILICSIDSTNAQRVLHFLAPSLLIDYTTASMVIEKMLKLYTNARIGIQPEWTRIQTSMHATLV